MDLLDPAEVRRILSHVDPDELFLIGGQALNIYAEAYSRVCPELFEFSPYLSKDIDFVGSFRAAQKLATLLGGQAKETKASSQAWMEAMIVVPRDGNATLLIDVLNHVTGTQDDELRAFAVNFSLPVRDDAGNLVGEIKVRLMHPLHVLQSRIANVLKVGDNPARRRQAEAAPYVLRQFLRDLLSQHPDGVVGVLKRLQKWLRSDEVGKRAHEIVRLDPRDILAEHLESEQLDPRWRQNQLASGIASIDRYRASKQQGAKKKPVS